MTGAGNSRPRPPAIADFPTPGRPPKITSTEESLPTQSPRRPPLHDEFPGNRCGHRPGEEDQERSRRIRASPSPAIGASALPAGRSGLCGAPPTRWPTARPRGDGPDPPPTVAAGSTPSGISKRVSSDPGWRTEHWTRGLHDRVRGTVARRCRVDSSPLARPWFGIEHSLAAAGGADFEAAHTLPRTAGVALRHLLTPAATSGPAMTGARRAGLALTVREQGAATAGAWPVANSHALRSRATATDRSSGAKENRTPDLFHAMEALYQLSYSPIGRVHSSSHRAPVESRRGHPAGRPGRAKRVRSLRVASLRCGHG